MGLQPLFYFVAGMMRRLVQPQHNVPEWTGRPHLLQPANRSLRVLPVTDKRYALFPRPQMYRPINVFCRFAARPIRNQGLLPRRAPAPCYRPFHIHLALIAGQGRDRHAPRRQIGQGFCCLPFTAGLLRRAALDIELAPPLITPVELPHQLTYSAPTVPHVKALLQHGSNRPDGPPAAHHRARHRFVLQHLTELSSFCFTQPPPSMFPTPAGMILQPIKPLLLILPNPATDALFIHKEHVGDLTIRVALGHQQQRVIALALVTIEFFVFVLSQGFLIVLWAQHPHSSLWNRIVRRRLYSFTSNSTSWRAGHIVSKKNFMQKSFLPRKSLLFAARVYPPSVRGGFYRLEGS